MIRSPPVTRKFNGSSNGMGTPSTVNNVTTPPMNGINNNNVNYALTPPIDARSRSRSPSQRNAKEMGNGIDKVRVFFTFLFKSDDL